MIQTLVRNWGLLVLCAVLEALLSANYLVMQERDGHWALRSYALPGTVTFLGQLALAAGFLALGASLWRSVRGRCWPLLINGLALGAMGLLFLGAFGPRVSFRSIAGLLVVMAASLCLLAVSTVRALGHRTRNRWIAGTAGLLAFAFALVFAWMQPQPGTHSEILWIGAYLGFQSLCLLGLALRLHMPEAGGWSTSTRPPALPHPTLSPASPASPKTSSRIIRSVAAFRYSSSAACSSWYSGHNVPSTKPRGARTTTVV